MNNWLKITIITNPILVDSISDYLVGIIGAGVEIGVDDHISLTTLNGFVENVNPGQEEIENYPNFLSQLLKKGAVWMDGMINLISPCGKKPLKRLGLILSFILPASAKMMKLFPGM